jgi:ribosome-binding protein aMBF1 (putative translation factor)
LVICRKRLTNSTSFLTANQSFLIDFYFDSGQIKGVKTIKVRFGEKVRQARKGTGLSQEEVSKAIGVFRSYLSRIETGKANPTLLVMEAISRVLGTELWELLK